MARGSQRELTLRPRRICYSGNGLRSVPVETTLAEIERHFLASDQEVQFLMLSGAEDPRTRAWLKYFSPDGADKDELFFGKGTTGAQAVISASLEFIERQCAKLRHADLLIEASYLAVASDARDPRLFCLSPEASFDPARVIDWIWGYSLTEAEAVLVPANLVFFPYVADRQSKFIAWNDSNGLASGNNLEEAVLHGIMEVVERDAVMIDEYNRLPRKDIALEGLLADVRRVLASLAVNGYTCSFKCAMTDLPIPVVSAFLRHEEDPANCCAAFGCYLDPQLAFSRALTEAVQLLPPSINQEEWLASGASERYAARSVTAMAIDDLENLATEDLKDNIERSVAILKEFGSEVIVVDLSLPDVRFPAVRVLATVLQPLLHQGDMRLSRRFFEVPVRLGLRAEPLAPADIKMWPLCGHWLSLPTSG
jgi:ribosomal protein S12 methylthiotransferase accessory factor